MSVTAVINPAFPLGAMASALATIYQMGIAVNEFVDDHIERLKKSDNATIARSGRVLEGAKFGFGLGYIAPMTVMAAGQLLLGNPLTAAWTVVTGMAAITNPVAITCASMGAIYFGWKALNDQERNDILNRLAEGLSLGVELIKSIIGFVLSSMRNLMDSNQIAEIKQFVKIQAAQFGHTLYDITKSAGDLVLGAAEKVGGAVTTTVGATGDMVKDSLAKVGTLAADATRSTIGATINATSIAREATSDAVESIRKKIGKTSP
jgi:hypothetical protein